MSLPQVGFFLRPVPAAKSAKLVKYLRESQHARLPSTSDILGREQAGGVLLHQSGIS